MQVYQKQHVTQNNSSVVMGIVCLIAMCVITIMIVETTLMRVTVSKVRTVMYIVQLGAKAEH